MKDKFLPIGTVVMLKNGTKEVMITSYLVFPKGTEIQDGKEVKPKKKMYDYGGCTFPEGIINSDISLVFNHSQISKIIHMGYQNDSQTRFSALLNDKCDEIKDRYINGTLSDDE